MKNKIIKTVVALFIIILFGYSLSAQVRLLGGYTYAPDRWEKKSQWNNLNLDNPIFQTKDEMVTKRFSSQIGLGLKL